MCGSPRRVMLERVERVERVGGGRAHLVALWAGDGDGGARGVGDGGVQLADVVEERGGERADNLRDWGVDFGTEFEHQLVELKAKAPSAGAACSWRSKDVSQGRV